MFTLQDPKSTLLLIGSRTKSNTANLIACFSLESRFFLHTRLRLCNALHKVEQGLKGCRSRATFVSWVLSTRTQMVFRMSLVCVYIRVTAYFLFLSLFLPAPSAKERTAQAATIMDPKLCQYKNRGESRQLLHITFAHNPMAFFFLSSHWSLVQPTVARVKL